MTRRLIEFTRTALTAAATALFLVAPAHATTLTLLDVDFDNIAVSSATATPNVAEVSGQLPPDTTWFSSNGNANNVNIRRSDNAINTNAGATGFANFFTPSSGRDNFLVLGDNEGVIGTSSAPTSGIMGLTYQFSIPSGAHDLSISFRFFFNGTDTNTNRDDLFTVDLLTADTIANDPILTLSSLDGFGNGLFNGFFELPGQLTSPVALLVFTLDERAGNTNTAVGIDDILVTATVPEPGTLVLLGVGLAGLALVRRRRA